MEKTYTDKLIEQSKRLKKRKKLNALKKLKKRLNQPLLKGGVRVSSEAGIRGFFR